MGLYTMIEDPSDDMLEAQFGDDSGNLYKPDGEGAKWARFVQDSFVKKTNERPVRRCAGGRGLSTV